ncbi:MAG: hypothetical protein IKI57_07125 [Clostridia bacterium]|nr:hypothetical protein [Clostridia bacterium]
MAVQVKSKTVTCPKCHELLEYTSADVRKTNKYERCTVHDLDDTFYKAEDTYEIWSITCPTCHNSFEVEKHFISSRKV